MTNTNNHARVAVVTGASSGIGEATARALAAGGYRVALLARRVERIAAIADELDNGSIAIQADVTDRDSVLAAAERVQQELGGADVLVNNAGVMLLGPFATDQRADYRQMIEVNLLGAITATEVFLDQLKDRAAERGGDIVNISSVAGRTARAGNGVYAATEVGPQRLVRVPAPGAAPRRTGHPDRARRRRDRAPQPHHARRDAAGRPAALQPGRGHRRRRRRGHRLRPQPPAAPRHQRRSCCAPPDSSDTDLWTKENHNARTHTRHARPSGVPPRPRLHGHEPVVRSTTTTRRDDHVRPCRGGPGRHRVRHR